MHEALGISNRLGLNVIYLNVKPSAQLDMLSTGFSAVLTVSAFEPRPKAGTV